MHAGYKPAGHCTHRLSLRNWLTIRLLQSRPLWQLVIRRPMRLDSLSTSVSGLAAVSVSPCLTTCQVWRAGLIESSRRCCHDDWTHGRRLIMQIRRVELFPWKPWRARAPRDDGDYPDGVVGLAVILIISELINVCSWCDLLHDFNGLALCADWVSMSLFFV